MSRNRCSHNLREVKYFRRDNRNWGTCIQRCCTCGASKSFIFESSGEFIKIPGKRWSSPKSIQSELNSPLTHPKVRVD
jgi:hypothetical protein